MNYDEDEDLEVTEEDEEGKFRDEYDEDFLTAERTVTKNFRITVHSHDGYGVATQRHVEMNPDVARGLAQHILEELDG